MKSLGVLLIAGIILVAMVTGFLCFLLPFNRVTTNTHLVFALLMVGATVWHLIERRKNFHRHVNPNGASSSGRKDRLKYMAIPLIGLVILACVVDWPMVRSLAALGYEGRHRNVIFRSQPDVVYEAVESDLRVLKDAEGLGINLEVELRSRESVEEETFVAIWAEDDNGNLIETLFLSESLCYQDHYSFGNTKLTRRQILPVWAHLRSKELDEETDDTFYAISSATILRSFSLNTVLLDGMHGFHLKMEVSRLGDSNEMFRPDGDYELLRTLPGLGQPSVVYTSFLDLHEEHIERYFLLQYEGYGAPMGDDGFVTYGHEGLTTARTMVGKALLHIEFSQRATSP